MEVRFEKRSEERLTHWEARRGARTVVPGTTMALGRGDMPHDLVQLVVEGAAGIDHGFWGCVASGATFKSMGRKPTRPGRAVIASHRADLDRAEQEVGCHVADWRAGRSSPVTRELDRFSRLWARVPAEGVLTVEWPTLLVTGGG